MIQQSARLAQLNVVSENRKRVGSEMVVLEAKCFGKLFVLRWVPPWPHQNVDANKGVCARQMPCIAMNEYKKRVATVYESTVVTHHAVLHAMPTAISCAH